jgi:hypothetical protein
MSKVLRAPRMVWRAAPLVLMFFALQGCQSFMFNYKGAKVNQGSLIALPVGVQQSGNYETRDLSIGYQIKRTENELHLSGLAQFAPSIRNNFLTVPYFHMSLFLADANGNVLENRGVVTSGYGYTDDNMRFDTSITLPPGTAYMAFAYDGRARGAGGGDGDSQDEASFWEYPVYR